MDLLKPLFDHFLTRDCYEKLIVERAVEFVCLKLVLSRLLGYGITVGASLVKVPQILKIWNHKSCAGLNIWSVFMDLFAITTHATYCYLNRYPFSSWGDSFFLDIETAAILFFVFLYGSGMKIAVVFLSLFVGIVSTLVGGVVPLHVMVILEYLVLPIALTGKMLQAYTNMKNGNTGNLSGITCFALAAGSIARIFTSIVETGDKMVVFTFIMTSIANTIIALQILYYWKPTNEWQKKHDKKLL